MIKQIFEQNSSCKLFPIFDLDHQSPGSGSGSVSALTKNAGSRSVSGYAIGSTTLDKGNPTQLDVTEQVQTWVFVASHSDLGTVVEHVRDPRRTVN